MKPASAVTILRSIEDGDPILVQLLTRNGTGDIAVADNAVVNLRIAIGGSVTVITGTGQGGGSGIWAFSPASLPQTPDRLAYSIAVTVGGFTYTHGKGFIELGDKV